MIATIFLVTLHKLMQLGSVNFLKVFIDVNKLKISTLEILLTPNQLVTRVLCNIRRLEDKVVQ
jgi:hypothetical protein